MEEFRRKERVIQRRTHVWLAARSYVQPSRTCVRRMNRVTPGEQTYLRCGEVVRCAVEGAHPKSHPDYVVRVPMEGGCSKPHLIFLPMHTYVTILYTSNPQHAR